MDDRPSKIAQAMRAAAGELSVVFGTTALLSEGLEFRALYSRGQYQPQSRTRTTPPHLRAESARRQPSGRGSSPQRRKPSSGGSGGGSPRAGTQTGGRVPCSRARSDTAARGSH